MLMARVSDGSQRVSLLGPTQTVCKTLFKYIFYVQGCFVSVCDARARCGDVCVPPAAGPLRGGGREVIKGRDRHHLITIIIICCWCARRLATQKGWATMLGMKKLARGGPCWKRSEEEQEEANTQTKLQQGGCMRESTNSSLSQK